jgi:type I restriction enzyme M protein
MAEIEKNEFNLNISRYISTSQKEVEIDLNKTNADLLDAHQRIRAATIAHNRFLKELGQPLLPVETETSP